MKRKLIIAGIVAAAAVGVWFFFFRRRQGAAVIGVTAQTPSPLTSISTLLSSPPKDTVSAALTYGANYLAEKLPMVGAGTTTSKEEVVQTAKALASLTPVQLGLVKPKAGQKVVW